MISSEKKVANRVFKLIPAEVESVVREGGGGEEGSESSSQVQAQ
jgi:hypothetical protein